MMKSKSGDNCDRRENIILYADESIAKGRFHYSNFSVVY